MENIKNLKTLVQTLTICFGLFFEISLNAQENSPNPLDNADKGLVFLQEQQDELTKRLTMYWTKKLTPVTTEEWNAKLTKKLSNETEEKLTAKIKKKWDPILNAKYPNSAQFYRQ